MHSHNSKTKMSSHSSIEESWEKKITTLLIDQNNENETEKTEPITCIFQVPESLRRKQPEAYTPQLVALGPYYHLDHNLDQMQNYKIDSGKKLRRKFQLYNLTERLTQELTQELSKCKGKDIHESYRGVPFIPYDQLALMMIIDGLFLLAILDKYVESNEIPDCSTFLRVLSSSGTMLPKDAILEDILKLENQIPRFVLKDIFSKTCREEEEYLPNLFVEFCRKISPIKVEWPDERVLKSLEHRHLLDLLYQYITFKKDNSKKTKKNHTIKMNAADSAGGLEVANGPQDCSLFSQLRNKMSLLKNIGPIKISLFVLDLFLSIAGVFGVTVETLFQEKQVLIPSVSELFNARIKIAPAEGGTRYVKFDEKTKTLHLPKISLNNTSLVVFRNLVMYETMAKPESLHFRRYAELMGAIVDTAEDLRLLRDFKVLELNKKYHMSDAEILEIFNGMTGTMRSKDATIDEQIKETKKCYNMYPVVRMKRVLRKYVYSSWKLLAVFASILLILMMGLQSFCNLHRCLTAFTTASRPR